MTSEASNTRSVPEPAQPAPLTPEQVRLEGIRENAKSGFGASNDALVFVLATLEAARRECATLRERVAGLEREVKAWRAERDAWHFNEGSPLDCQSVRMEAEAANKQWERAHAAQGEGK